MTTPTTPKTSKPLLRFVLLAARLVLGGSFVVAGYKKLVAPVEEFAAAIRTYDVLPAEWMISAVAHALPWIEVVIGAALVLGLFVRAMSAVHVGLLVIFLVLIVQGLLRGLDIDCGCFGSGSTDPIDTIIRDVVLLLLGIMLIAKPSRWLTLDARFDTRKEVT